MTDFKFMLMRLNDQCTALVPVVTVDSHNNREVRTFITEELARIAALECAGNVFVVVRCIDTREE